VFEELLRSCQALAATKKRRFRFKHPLRSLDASIIELCVLERPNAHLYETGGMRRTHLRGHGNILKRLLVHVAACNLGLWMRPLTGIGTPRGLQGRWAAVGAFYFTLWVRLCDPLTAHRRRGLDLRVFALRNHRFALIPYVL
jgi:hypothetical protein